MRQIPRRVCGLVTCVLLGFAVPVFADTCGCGAVGAYVPGSSGAFDTSSPFHQVTLTGGGTFWEFKLSGAGASLDLPLPATPIYYFWADYTRLVVSYSNGGISTSTVYALDKPGTPAIASASDANLGFFTFSPLGHYMYYSTGSGLAMMGHVLRSDDATVVYSWQGGPASFGPDDASFAYGSITYTPDTGTIHPQELSLVNTRTKSLVYHLVRYEIVSWDFSPCGDLLDVYSWPDSAHTATDLDLLTTRDGGVAASVATPGLEPVYASASQHYYVNLAVQPATNVFLANNTAPLACPANVLVTGLSPSTSSLVSGVPVVMTVTLGGPAPAGGVAVALSTDSPLVSSGMLTVPAGATTALDTLSTLAFGGSTVTVHVTATASSSTASTSVTLHASPLADVTPGDRPALALEVLGASPVRGMLTLRCTLDRPGPARLVLFDLSGRRLVERGLTAAGGEQVVSMPEVATLAPGLYFARLEQMGDTRVTRVILLR